MTRAAGLITALRGGVVVSCQAPEGSPLRQPAIMAAMAQAAALAGAVGIRANGPADVAAIRAVVDLPIIGLDKRPDIDPQAYITPSLDSVAALVAAGADLVAIDATLRPRNGSGAASAADLLAQIRHTFPGLPVMADVSNLAEGVAAAAAGADIVATTLSGYTGGPVVTDGPDLELVAALVKAQGRPVVAEGRFATPEQVLAALHAGAHAVVVGTAITDTLALARKFVKAVDQVRVEAAGRETTPAHS
ncbi:MAG: putative N-acetylmannosamine-6-phosphate 2-epimerase [Trueperaceae bacterium]|nr:putative N-acetylmannosamine-6-phosphate 2-epimerase [Trueperaceae bacterium]